MIWDLLSEIKMRVLMLLHFFKMISNLVFLTSSNDVLISQIVSTVSKSKESKLENMSREIESFIKNEFKSIEDNIKEKAKKISIVLIDSFFTKLNEPLESLTQKLKSEESILLEQINKFGSNDENRAELSVNIHKKIKKMNAISNKIQGLF